MKKNSKLEQIRKRTPQHIKEAGDAFFKMADLTITIKNEKPIHKKRLS